MTNSICTETCRSLEDEKWKGDAAFRSGNYERAFEAYSAVAGHFPENINVLLNRSIAALRLGRAAIALEDARSALVLLSAGSYNSSGSPEEENEVSGKLAKAYYREASALAGLGRHDEALASYKSGLRAKPGEKALCKALEGISHRMKLDWLSRYFAELVTDAQSPNRLSSRDGKLLKPPIDKCCLCYQDLQSRIREALLGRETEFRRYVCTSWFRGKDPGRCILSILRAYAYLLHAKCGREEAIEQSVRDARAAVAYMPSKGIARAYAVHAAVLEHMGDYTAAMVEIMEGVTLDPESEELNHEAMTLKSKLTDQQRQVVEKEGLVGLRRWLEDEREKSLPEFMRKRPKYYYYYEWMKKRIHAYYPQLPEPVMDKLLTCDADELDLLLQYPQAIKGQVDEFLAIHSEHGAEYLASYQTPRIPWEEAQRLEQGSSGALGENPKQTNHALVAGGGAGQITDDERRGLPVPPRLAPDDARDQIEAAGRMGTAHTAAAAIEPQKPLDQQDQEEDLDGVD